MKTQEVMKIAMAWALSDDSRCNTCGCRLFPGGIAAPRKKEGICSSGITIENWAGLQSGTTEHITGPGWCRRCGWSSNVALEHMLCEGGVHANYIGYNSTDGGSEILCMCDKCGVSWGTNQIAARDECIEKKGWCPSCRKRGITTYGRYCRKCWGQEKGSSVAELCSCSKKCAK